MLALCSLWANLFIQASNSALNIRTSETPKYLQLISGSRPESCTEPWTVSYSSAALGCPSRRYQGKILKSIDNVSKSQMFWIFIFFKTITCHKFKTIQMRIGRCRFELWNRNLFHEVDVPSALNCSILRTFLMRSLMAANVRERSSVNVITIHSFQWSLLQCLCQM